MTTFGMKLKKTAGRMVFFTDPPGWGVLFEKGRCLSAVLRRSAAIEVQLSLCRSRLSEGPCGNPLPPCRDSRFYQNAEREVRKRKIGRAHV